MPKKRLSFMASEDLAGRIDEVRGLVPRETWMRVMLQRAVEQALEAETGGLVRGSVSVARTSAPAEQPEKWEGFPVRTDERVPRGRVAAASPREFRPYPKGGK